MRISKTLESLFTFLKEKEQKGQLFNKEAILTATGWKAATFRTYWVKG